MGFTKYPKIPLSTKDMPDLPAGAEWIVTEKLHGANFSVACDADGKVEFAKRSGPLPLEEDFYSFRSQRLDRRLQEPARRVRALAVRCGLAASGDSVCVFGELVGGHYPHPDVNPVPGLQPVQRGVWYSPDLRFIGFDLAVTPHHQPPRYTDFDAAASCCEAAGFLFAAVLARGTLPHCLESPIRFSSRLPARLGLPSLEDDNLAEGVVVRTAREGLPLRTLLKRKIDEFGETRYSSLNWAAAKSGGARAASGPHDLLRYEAMARVTESRFEAVESKTGRLDAADKVACRKVLEDFKEDVRLALVEDGVASSEAALAEALSQELCDELDRACRGLIGSVVGRRARQERSARGVGG